MKQRKLLFLLPLLFLTLVFVPDKTFAQEQTICFYEEVEGEINDENPSQSYVFTASGQHTVTIEMAIISGSLEPLLEVYTQETGERIAVSTNVMLGGQPIAKLFNLRLTAGDYLILASRIGADSGNTNGRYRLTLDIGGSDLDFAQIKGGIGLSL